MATSVFDSDGLSFFYFLYDKVSEELVGVLTVNRQLISGLLYKNMSMKEVTETEHDSMTAFDIPKYVHDAIAHPFFEYADINIHYNPTRISIHDSRNKTRP